MKNNKKDYKQESLSSSESEVKVLLEKLKIYRDLENKINSLEKEKTKLPKGVGMFKKFNSPRISEIDSEIKEIKLELKQIGEDIKFQNPIIWMKYKSVAYISKDEETGLEINPNETLGKFENDVSTHQICGARMRFLNKYFKEKYNKTVQEYFSESSKLEDVAKSKEIIEISTDKEFDKKWKFLENYITEENGIFHSNKWGMEYGEFAEEYENIKLEKMLGSKDISYEYIERHNLWVESLFK